MINFTEREEESTTLHVLYLSHSGKRKHVGNVAANFIHSLVHFNCFYKSEEIGISS